MSGVTEQIKRSSPASFHKTYLYIYIPSLLLEYIDITQVIDNTVENSLLYYLLQYEREVSAGRELFETYFITIRYLGKEASYGKKYTGEEELELFKNNVRESL